MEKPSELSRCLVTIRDVVDIGAHKSNHLSADPEGGASSETVAERWVAMGSAVTPVDRYVELLLQQMLTNEESRCSIRTKANEVVFTMKLLRIEGQSYYYEQTVTEMLELAKRYKANGVKMYPKYPLFAHAYFSRAAKCLLSWLPIEQFEPSCGTDTGTFEEALLLLDTLHLNIAACLIKQNRFDEVPHVLRYTKDQAAPSAKAIYRKAFAHYKLKEYAEAQATLQRIDYGSSKECAALYKDIAQARHQDDSTYSTMVKKMFV